MKLYSIYDTETKTYFRTGRGKHVWNATNHAKNAWNTAQYGRSRVKFDQQERYVLVEMALVTAAELKALQSDSDDLAKLHAGGVDNWEWYSESLYPDGYDEDDEDDE